MARKPLMSKAELEPHIAYERAQLEQALARKSIDAFEKDGRTPLMHFASSTLWAFRAEADPICVDQVTKILARAPDLEIKDKHGWTALFHAVVQAGSPTVVKLLLDRGADPNVRDDGGYTPLHFAAERGIVSIVEDLLAAGAKVDVKTDLGKKPIECTKKDAIRKLLSARKRATKPEKKSAKKA
jgi:ankyrin repeat protein